MAGLIDRKAIIKELGSASQPDELKVKRSDIVYRHMRDPALLRYYYSMKMMPVLDRLDLSGSSPTDIFIGRFGYPNVTIGPMVPPEFGDTSILAVPERWRAFSIEQIVSSRSKLVRGMHKSRVDAVEKGRIEEQIRDLALADRPAEAELTFSKKPFVKIALNDEVQPFGPSADIKAFDIYNIKANKQIEKLYMDVDADAGTAIRESYESDIPVSKIQQALSAGLFGLGRRRKFVPTRWSITAVDDTLSKGNLKEVKEFDEIDSIHMYYNISLDNRWLIIFVPGRWKYESAEAWYPKTIWNEGGTSISIYSSYEGYNGRKTYAEIGGCYYAARLAVVEHLNRIRRQGAVLVLREAGPGYLLPAGVWLVRENVRKALAGRPVRFGTLQAALTYAAKRLKTPWRMVLRESRLLRNIRERRRITEYLKE
ncbi:MAG: hypothetical protein QW194_01270 [Candidatus Micrarchaeaceae archaeon]